MHTFNLDDLRRMMRNQAVERAIGELQTILHTYTRDEDEERLPVEGLIIRFIADIGDHIC